MLGILDLATMAVIEKKIENLIRCPDWLEFILCGFHGNKELFDLVGPEYIKESIEYISNNKINIHPYYNEDLKQSPSIAIIASGNEGQQYIGDQGLDQFAQPKSMKFSPVTIAEWTAKAIDGNMMTVPPELRLNEKLWPGIIITNGTIKVILDGIVDASTLCLKDDLPDGLDPKGWRATTAGSNRIYAINASTDDVTVQCKLTSHGEPGNHRLLGLILRSVLKSSRLDFDRLGFQNTRISYSPMVLTNQEEMEFESVYSINGIFTDHWIHQEIQGPDSACNIGVNLTATNKTPGGDVDL